MDDGFKVFIGIVGLVIAVILFFVMLPFVQIGAGERGVVMTWGKVQEHVLEEGLHWRTPIAQTVKVIDVRVQKSDVKAEAASSDLQDVHMDIVVNYHIDPKRVNKVYQQIGDNKDVFDRIISPNTNEIVKAATAKYKAEDIVKKRRELKDSIDKSLLERLVTYGVILDDVSLTNVDFSQEFNAAIEAKQVAEQQVQQAQFIADKAKKDADAAIRKAEGESQAQRLQLQTLTPELLQKLAIEKWDGHFPTTFSGGELPFLKLVQ